MRLKDFLAEEMKAEEVTAQVEKLKTAIKNAGWDENDAPGNSKRPVQSGNFWVSQKSGKYTFYIDTAIGQNGDGLSSKKLGVLIDPFYKKIRDAGGDFSQPKAADDGKWHWETDDKKSHGNVVTFTISSALEGAQKPAEKSAPEKT